MKKKFLFFALVAAGLAIGNVSCGSDDDNDDNSTAVVRPQGTETIHYQMSAANAPTATASDDSEASLTKVDFTEYGKAILELNVDGKLKYASYDATANGDVYTLKDSGKTIGTITKKVAASRAASVTLAFNLSFSIDGITFSFNEAEAAASETTSPAPAATSSTGKIVNTWTVERMKLVLDFDDSSKADASTTSTGGSLKPFIDLAKRNNVNISEEDEKQLDRTIQNLILTADGANGGLLILKYADGRSDDAASWNWKSTTGTLQIGITLKDFEMGNKFLNDNTKIEIEVKSDGNINLMMSTHLDKDNCTASLLVNLK